MCDMKRLLEFYMPLILTSIGALVTGGCLTGCGSDPALLLFAVDIVQQEEINDLSERLDNLPVPQDGVDGEDGVTTVIVIRQPLPDPIVIRPVVQIDPVCVKVDVCHRGHTQSICLHDAANVLKNDDTGHMGACE